MAHAEAIGSGGKPVLLVAGINDATGETITVAAAATPQAIKSATLFTATLDNTGGILDFDGTTGVVTVDDLGVGSYEVQAIVGDGIATNSAVIDIEIWASVGGAAKAQIGRGARKTELATAARNGIAPAFAIFSPTAVGDTVEARVRVGTNGHELVIRDFTLVVKKVG